MRQDLRGRNAIVTGSTRGIGLAIAERLLEEGVSVAICGRNQAATDSVVRSLSDKGRVVGQSCDVADAAEVSRFFQFVDGELGSLDVLVNNAGLGIFRSVSDLSIEEWHQTLSVNLNGAFYCSREALPRLRQRGGGTIINVSSLAAKNPFAGGAAYNASKFGLNGFSEAMMLDHRHDNIRVTSIMPGSVDTQFSNRNAGAAWKIAPEDIAEVVVDVLQMPQRTTISAVEIRPSRPPAKS